MVVRWVEDPIAHSMRRHAEESTRPRHQVLTRVAVVPVQAASAQAVLNFEEYAQGGARAKAPRIQGVSTHEMMERSMHVLEVQPGPMNSPPKQAPPVFEEQTIESPVFVVVQLMRP